MKRSGLTTIEVLIAFIIAFSGIILFHSATKSFMTLKQQVNRYEALYITVNSLKERIISTKDLTSLLKEGELNGFAYRLDIKEMRRKQVPKGFEGFDVFTVILYDIRIEIEKKEQLKTYHLKTVRIL